MKLAEFVKWCIKESSFEGCDLDGWAVQDKAVEFGILIKTEYDPAKHGKNDDAEPGDEWFVFSEDFKKALTS